MDDGPNFNGDDTHGRIWAVTENVQRSSADKADNTAASAYFNVPDRWSASLWRDDTWCGGRAVRRARCGSARVSQRQGFFGAGVGS